MQKFFIFTGITAFVVALAMLLYWMLWLLYENCVCAVFTSMPHCSYWQFFGIMIALATVAGFLRSKSQATPAE